MLVRLLVIGLILNFSNHIFAQNLKCSKNGTLITFTNGILTSEPEAKDYKKAIEKFAITKNSLDKSGKVSYKLIYNTSENAFIDLYESVRQEIQQAYNTTSGQAAAKFFSILYGLIIAPNPLKSSIVGINTRIIQNFILQNDPEYQKVMAKHSETWKKAFDIDGQKIIAISHSQGGYFINDAYVQLMTGRNPKFKDLFVMLQVATPVSGLRAANQKNEVMGDYITNDHDIIRLIPRSLSSNVTLSIFETEYTEQNDGAAHGFEKTYLALFSILIQQKMVKVAKLLGPNCPCETADGLASEPGSYFTNPDGTTGGYVGNNVIIYQPELDYIGPDVQICGYSVLGEANYLSGDIKISGSQNFDQNSNIYESTLRTTDTGSIRIENISQVSFSNILVSGNGSFQMTTSSSVYDSIMVLSGNIKINRSNILYSDLDFQNVGFDVTDYGIIGCVLRNGVYSARRSTNACSVAPVHWGPNQNP
jgi:hypothetical protein